MSQAKKVLITGGAGQIGYALLFRIASGQMFGPNVPVELHLLELPHALQALQGVLMELEDCAFPLLKNVVCTSDMKVATKDINFALLVGAVPRKAGMERADLLNINGQIFTEQGRAINENAARDVRVLVVGNPCNTNCLIAMNNARDIPRKQFFAMTMLDENRAYGQLAKKANVSLDKIKRVGIWGNHSATQYPDFYNATIDGKPVPDVIKDEAWLQNEFIKTVQQRGAEVLKARGASSAASAANAVVDTVHHLVTETASDNFYSVASCSTGDYGVDEGLIFSFPTQTVGNDFKIVKGIEHGKFSQERIKATLEELRQERDAVKALGLI